jgi:hypothetical protein
MTYQRNRSATGAESGRSQGSKGPDQRGRSLTASGAGTTSGSPVSGCNRPRWRSPSQKRSHMGSPLARRFALLAPVALPVVFILSWLVHCAKALSSMNPPYFGLSCPQWCRD